MSFRSMISRLVTNVWTYRSPIIGGEPKLTIRGRCVFCRQVFPFDVEPPWSEPYVVQCSHCQRQVKFSPPVHRGGIVRHPPSLGSNVCFSFIIDAFRSPPFWIPVPKADNAKWVASYMPPPPDSA